MGFTTVTYLDAGDYITNAWVDMVAANLEYLLAPNYDESIYDNTSDYTETDTSFVDVDATNVSVTLTTYGGHVAVNVIGSVYLTNSANNAVYLDLDVDGSRIGDSTYGLLKIGSYYSSEITNCSFSKFVYGLSAASHTIKLQWKLSANAAWLWRIITIEAVEL